MRTIDLPNFELFDRQNMWSSEPPHVTIQKRGVLSLNLAAHHAIGSPEAVELLYDRGEQIIGIRAASPDAKQAVPTWTPTGKSRPVQISAAAFMKYFGIRPDVATRRPATVDGGILCIDLKMPGEPVGRVRALS